MNNNLIDTYAIVINSVNEFSLAVDAMQAGEKNIPMLTQLILSRETEISKFETITQELSQYLENFSFKSGCQFDDLQKNLQALFILNDKLTQMTLDAESLAGNPDLYGLMETIKQCRELTLTCYRKLVFKDIEKASKKIDNNLQKLSGLKQKFKEDGCVLNQMQEAIENEKPLLIKYMALWSELEQYLQNFPHSGEDNLAEVTKRIDIAKQMDSLIISIDKDINQIKPFYDRHNKESVVTNYTNTLQDIRRKMNSRNWQEYAARLQNVARQIPYVIRAFKEEKDALVHLRTTLEQRKPDIWKDDNEKILHSINKLLNTNTAIVKVDLNSLNKEILEATKKREREISATLEKYSWLSKNKYIGFHTSLIERYITYVNYQSEIESVRKERIKRIWKNIGKGVGIVLGIAIAIYIIWFLIAAVIAWAIFKIAIRSND